MKKNVALIFGGRSLESDISIITAMQALTAVDRSKYRVCPVYMYGGDFFVDGLDALDEFESFIPAQHTRVMLQKGEFFAVKKNKLIRRFRPDVALICCHGGEGENGVLQSILEYNGIPYTSPQPLQSAIAMDKAASKLVFEGMRLNVLPFEEVSKSEFESNPESVLTRLEQTLGYPLIAKPCSLGSSIGIAAAQDRQELEFALEVACKFDGKIVVEKLLEGCAEINCAAFRDGDSVIISETERPISAGDFLSFEEKYMSDGKMSGGQHRIPAGIGSAELVVKAITERIYRELDLNGVVRIDYLVDGNKVYVNEINTVPGSLAFYLFESVGISFDKLIDKIIDNAVSFAAQRGNIIRTFKTDVLKRFGKGGCKLKK